MWWAYEIEMIMSKRDEGRANIGSSQFVVIVIVDDDVFVVIPCSFESLKAFKIFVS